MDQIRVLREQPEIGRKGRRAGTRELVVDGTRDLVAYRIDAANSQIQILCILHTSRRWPRGDLRIIASAPEARGRGDMDVSGWGLQPL